MVERNAKKYLSQTSKHREISLVTCSNPQGHPACSSPRIKWNSTGIGWSPGVRPDGGPQRWLRYVVLPNISQTIKKNMEMKCWLPTYANICQHMPTYANICQQASQVSSIWDSLAFMCGRSFRDDFCHPNISQLPGLPSERHGCTCRPRNTVQVIRWESRSLDTISGDTFTLIMFFFGSHSASIRAIEH